MTSIALEAWTEANQRHLVAALDRVRAALRRHAGPSDEGLRVDLPPAPSTETLDGAFPPALEALVTTFRLSPFERDTLLLCAGVELSSDFAALCAAAQADPSRPYPTFSLALAALPGAHWGALTPASPLRHWRLVEVGPGNSLTLAPLRVDEFVLHFLTGVRQLDDRVAGLVSPCQQSGELVPSHRALAEQIAAAWSRSSRTALPIVQLCGEDTSAKLSIAASACASLGLSLWRLPVNVIPTGSADIETFVRLWNRQAALGTGALLIDCDEPESDESARASAISRITEQIGGPLFLASRERRRSPLRASITFEVRRPTVEEQRGVWADALMPAPQANGSSGRLGTEIEQLTSQFNLGAQAIRAAGFEALARHESANGSDGVDLGRTVWEACRVQARPRLDDLAQRIDPAASWDDLVLPEAQRQIIHDVAAHVRQRGKVYETWGFATKGARGLGISALFAGASGTGKTMAAEVLASELSLDLYRIDLSAVVSKYIGETEKNLRRVFDAAEEGGAVLLFDEADALFGKRSEVKDSHDRYANVEVSYLLQRMEAYRGLAILTTNLKNALDSAFLRRLRFVVQFPFPDAIQRAAIWRRIFPLATPTAGLDPVRLAQLNVPGGNIRNIALNAAFLAADAGEPVRMPHLLRAARAEYAKLEKPLTEVEIGGWV